VQIDPVDIFFTIVGPPVVTLVAYFGGAAAGRITNGGQPLSLPTRTFLKWASIFTLGALYLMMILGTLKFPEWTWLTAGLAWGLLLIVWIRLRNKRAEIGTGD
jgi:hypothetical protein